MDKLRTVFSLFMIFIFGFFVWNFIQPKASEVPPNVALQNQVKSTLEGTTGHISIAFKNLNTNQTYFLNEKDKFESGSLYKLWVMGAVYRKIESGDLREDDELSYPVDELNNQFGITTDEADLNSGTLDFSVNSALTQMITISHNYAALSLSQKIGLSYVKTYVKDNGFTDTEVGQEDDYPKTTALDILKFFEKLYKEELGNPDSTKKMLVLLKDQQLNDKIPKKLPVGTIIAHKTGEIDSFSHDAGIIYTPKGNYILVILTDTPTSQVTEDKIADISKSFYNFVTE